MEEDGFYRPEIKPHSLEKIHRHNYYAALFSKAMHRRWRHRVYIGLYAGAGRALVQPGGELVETSALAVLRQEYPFTKYIFVDSDARCIEALKARIAALGSDFDVTLIAKPVNDAVLVMLPLGYDVRRNLRRYLEDEGEDRLGALIDAPDWREQWRNAQRPDRQFIRFVMEKFDEAMERLGFRRREMKDTVPVKVAGMGVYLYSLALYTRHELGEQFWKTTIAAAEPQYDMGL